MKKILAVGNQKGGVGKTTSTLNVGAGLAAKGYKVLLVDFDPQGNLSSYLGFEPDGKLTVGDLMHREVSGQPYDVKDCIRTNAEGLHYIPSALSLSSADYFLVNAMSREMVLRRILTQDELDEYDYILIDCLPSLGILLINALACADGVIIPVQAQKFALDGLKDFIAVFTQIKTNLNPGLCIEGILVTMADDTNMSKAVTHFLKETYQHLVFDTSIRKSVEATNSTYDRKSLIQTKRSRLGDQYRKLTDELIMKRGGDPA